MYFFKEIYNEASKNTSLRVFYNSIPGRLFKEEYETEKVMYNIFHFTRAATRINKLREFGNNLLCMKLST